MDKKLTEPTGIWDKLLHYGVIAIFALVPFHAILTVFIGSNFGYYELVRLWKEVLLSVLAVVALILVIKDSALRQWMANSWIVRVSLAFIATVVVLAAYALIQGSVTPKAVGYGAVVAIRPVLFMLVVIVMVRRGNHVRWARLLVAPALVVIIFGLLQFFILPNDFLRHFGYGPATILPFQTIDNIEGYARVQSTMRGPNPLGAYLVAVITLLILGLVHFNDKKRYALAIAAAALVLFGSYSRSAVIGAAISVGILLGWTVQRRSARRLFWTLSVILLVGGTLMFLGLRSSVAVQNVLFHTSDRSSSKVSSNEQRGRALTSAVKDIVHEPLGGGVGTAGPASFYNTQRPPRLAENYFLQIGQEAGIIGMGLFITLLVLIIQRLWDRRQHGLSRAVLASLIGLLFINMISHAWADDTLAYISWGLIAAGITVKVSKDTLPTASRHKESTKAVQKPKKALQ